MVGEMSDLEIHEVFHLHGIGGCEPGNLFHGTLIARRLRALERVVEAARKVECYHCATAQGIDCPECGPLRTALAALDKDVACSCRGCQRIRTALAALDEGSP